jgi:outer membrane protein OmpA-like peptidoglycan-associated protein/tetratricopeptide (TPR) repeat protein
MRNLFKSLLILLAFNSLLVNAQTDVSVRRKDFKVEKEGFKEAWKHVEDGNSFFEKGGVWYSRAFDEYIKAIVYNSSNAELNYKTGVSALFSDNREEAAGFLIKALQVKPDVTDDILFLTGRALHYSGKYIEAIEKFEAYIATPGKKEKKSIAAVNRAIDECKSALEVTKDTLRVKIENLGVNINSGSDDYSQIFTSDGLIIYFGSRRQMPRSGKRYNDTKFDENIFVSNIINGAWSQSIPAGKNLVTKFCETPLYMDPFRTRLFIYAGYENGGDIKVAIANKKGEWKSPVAVPYAINSNGSETSFSFSPTGNEIFFVTDSRKDNYGEKDIYYIKRMSERKWSKPQNAGAKINTIFDEESVRFSKTGDTLYFSSKGHNSIGGFDIFYSVKDSAGEWGIAKNYGYPVNTPWDELFYYPATAFDSTFYFVSNRSGGIGGLDIYSGKLLPPEPVVVILPPPPPPPPARDTIIVRDTVVVIKEVTPPLPPVDTVVIPEPVKETVLYLVGKVTDSESGEPVMARMDVVDLKTDSVLVTSASSDIDGSYRIILPEKKSYKLGLRAAGFLSDMKRIDVPTNWLKDSYTLNIDLIKVKVGKKVVLNNILFETGKSILTASSYAELDRLLNIMNENTEMKIEISGHTDKTGSESINSVLSENRAKAVVEYLVQKGIDRKRMEYKGFGSLQPVTENTTPQGRAKNRRVEFKILEF